MRPRDRAARRGFGPLEIIVLLAVVAIVAVFTLPMISQAGRLQRIIESERILGDVALSEYNPSGTPQAFRQTVGSQVPHLSYLLAPIKNGDVDLCNKKLSAGGWVGPYIRFAYDSTVGLVTPIGIGSDDLTRVQIAGVWNIQITFSNVDLADVLLMDSRDDSGDGANAGFIQWTTNGGVTNFKFSLPVDNTC
jgi:hypothetical protein